jgi:elongation factor 1-gamma
MIVAESEPGSNLLGRDNKERAEIVQWISFASTHDTPAGLWVYPILGYMPFNKLFYTTAVDTIKKAMGTLDRYLQTRTFLVGDRVTLADIIVGSLFNPLYKLVLGPEHRDAFKNLNRWYRTIANQEEFKSVWGEFTWASVEAKPPAPKKEEKPKKKEAPAPAAVEEEDEAPKPKPAKSKLDLLPKSPLDLEEWKRFYSNNDTKPTAVNWFWEHFDAEGYSIWKVDYKYNDELAKVFMSANLIGGFFNRLERARKYAFGSLCVLGEDNKNEIAGYFVIRGHEIPEEVTDAADFESYSFVKVDNLADEGFRSDFADYLAWEGAFGGKKFADAKVFK